ncbi:ParB/Srx family N-terminal domain-containing protein [Mesorhizobium sp. M0514]|uniref:ParB/Srx family N-terminal domain-containing protein n=1 Tax=Mesorhizobium sp. M0514 TaxID=2956955 RepID=UPI00333B57E1
MATKITTVSMDALTPYRNNARTHSKKQIRQIADSIEKFGFTNPVLVDEKNNVLAGHGRLSAARLLGWKEVPTLSITHLNQAQKRAYIVADNRIAEKAGWDKQILAIELQALVDLDFDVSLTGFDIPEVDLIISEFSPNNQDDESEEDETGLPEQSAGPAITLPGDLFLLGEHRLLCGNALSKESFETLMQGRRRPSVSQTRPTTFRSADTSAGLARRATGNLQWHPARCPTTSS